MQEKEISSIVEEITGKDNYKVKKPLFGNVYRLEESKGLISNLFKTKAGKAVKAGIAGIILATASIPTQSVLDSLIPDHNIVATAKASQPRNEFELNKNDAIVLGSNMIFNAFMGGYGAHKQNSPHTKFWKDLNFWKGFKQGAIGGIPVYTGMKIMTFQNEFDYAILLGKQVSDLGTSITYSASLGENWLENPRYMTDIGPLVFSWNKEKGLKPELFILPGSVGSLIHYGFYTYDLNLEQSLKTGLFVFDGDPKQNIGGRSVSGRSDINLIIQDPNVVHYNQLLSHEAIHTRNNFQFMPLDSIINYYLKKTPTKLKLSYENHPFRFGAIVGFGFLSHSCFYSAELGIPYELQTIEFASSNLFNFED